MVEKRQVNLKISTELVDALDELAKDEYRTRTNMVEKILSEALKPKLEEIRVRNEGVVE